MSAPDYKDPRSKLKLRLVVFPGSAYLMLIACGLGILGACLCVVAFGVSLMPGVETSGNRFWALAVAAVFAGTAWVLYAVHKLLRRWERGGGR